MVTAAETAVPRTAPRRNWGGVVIAVTGAAFVVVAVIELVASSITNLPYAFAYLVDEIEVVVVLVSPLALVVGFVPLAFGGRRLRALAGSSIRGRLWVLAAPVVAAIAGFVVQLLISTEAVQSSEDAISGRADSSADADVGTLIAIVVFAVLVALIAGVVVARARIATGVGRWSLFVAVALAAATVWGYFAAAESFGTPLPYAVGILFLGLSWWRAGVATADRVPDQPKSLAE